MRVQAKPVHRAVLSAVVALLLVFASACGGDEAAEPSEVLEETSIAADDENASDAEEIANDETSTATVATEPDSEEPPAAASETVELTDSFRGVTSDAIKIGFTGIDFAELNSSFGLDLNFVTDPRIMDVLIGDLNERGGINGRRVEHVTAMFLPVGATTAESVCLQLTEDEPVFAVLNGFQGPGAEEVNLCITATHDTILIGDQAPQEIIEQSSALWVQRQMTTTRRTVAFANLLEQTGELDELGTIGVLAISPERATDVELIGAVLEAAGASVPLQASIASPPGDETAVIAEVEILVELLRSQGVQAVLLLGNSAIPPKQLMQLAPELVLLNPDNAAVADVIRESPNNDTVRYLSAGTTEQQLYEHPATQRCIDLVEAATDIVVIAPDDMTASDLNYSQAIHQRCQEVAMLEAILTAAGPDLTNNSAADAASNLGPFELPGVVAASLGIDKTSAPDSLSLLEWDQALRNGQGDWVLISDELVVG